MALIVQKFGGSSVADAEKIFALIHLHRDDLVPRPMGDIVAHIDRFSVAEVDGEMVGCAAYMVLPEIGSPLPSPGTSVTIRGALHWATAVISRSTVTGSPAG